MIERGLAAIRPDITREPIRLVYGDVENIAAVVFNGEIFPLMSVQLSAGQTREASNAVIHMDDKIPNLQVGIQRLRRIRRLSLARPGLRTFPAENFRVSN
ncbi:MAG TPA: hypothetical protein PLF42_11835 [Anaerolineales bacterium]|nr:hypothetical protein [Anaerolineales bacterium]